MGFCWISLFSQAIFLLAKPYNTVVDHQPIIPIGFSLRGGALDTLDSPGKDTLGGSWLGVQQKPDSLTSLTAVWMEDGGENFMVWTFTNWNSRILRESQHTPIPIPKAQNDWGSPKHKLLGQGVWGMFQGYVGKLLDNYIVLSLVF